MMETTEPLTLKTNKGTLRAKIKRKQKNAAKNVLNSPYSISWPMVEPAVETEILTRLKSIIEPLGIARIYRPPAWKRQKPSDISKNDDVQKGKGIEDTKQIKKQLVLGVNNVTRNLEKDNLRLVLLCQSAEPKVLIKHLLTLSASRQCSILYIPNLSSTLCQLLNLRSAVALGFKKATEDHVFDAFVKFVQSSAPKLELPWLKTISEKETDSLDTKELDDNSDSEQTTEDIKSGSKEPNVIPDKTEDYSRFYVYKSEKKVQKMTCGGQDFISFGETTGNSSKTEATANLKLTGIKRKKSDNTSFGILGLESEIPLKKPVKSSPKKSLAFAEYKPTEVKQMYTNKNRKQKQKKLKKKS